MLSLSLENLFLALKEFLTVWINQILYYNNVYNEEVFSKFKSFDLIVYKSRNPILNDYIDELLNNFFTVLIRKNEPGKVNKMSVMIYDTKSSIVKKIYTFRLHDLIELGDLTPNLDFLHQENISETLLDIPNVSWRDIYNQFKTISYEHINDLKEKQKSDDANDDLFFKIILEVDDSIDLNIKETGYNWVRINNPDSCSNTAIESDTERRAISYKSIGEVGLSVMNFDIHNEYMI